MTIETLDPVAAVRGFNRFYTRQIGALDEGHLGSPFSLAEGRALYEIGQAAQVAPKDVAERAGLDAGYLSRILKRFEAEGLIARDAAPDDGRSHVLSLTDQGLAAFAELQNRSNTAVEALLGQMPAGDRARLTRAMDEVRGLLAAPAQRAEVVLRPHRLGDMGWITHRHAVLYAREYGWGPRFEALVARIAADFIETYDPARARSWIADREGEILGSIFLEDAGEGAARIRLLYLEPAARGLGLGMKLVGEAVAFARAAGYVRITLWTQSVLTAARRIYTAHGFEMVEAKAHTLIGHELIGETWVLEL